MSLTRAEDKNIKQIQISEAVAKGVAAAEMGALSSSEGGGSANTRKRRGGGRANKTLRLGLIEKEGGGATSPGTLVQLTASHVPGGALVQEPVGRNASLTRSGAPFEGGGGGGAASTPAAASHTPPSSAKPVKVVLAPKAKKTVANRLVLAAGTPKPAGLQALKGGVATTHKTRKVRKIKMSMRGLSKKIHRARTIRQKATETKLEHIKKELQKAGLIKADSKAPDTIIRQMYADYMTLKTRAL